MTDDKFPCVIFENPGEIDPLLIRTFGAHVKVGDSPIGIFGTGLKYALAIITRTPGHKITIQSGERVHAFGLVEKIIREKVFRFITMDGEPLGFTDELGKTWDMAMAHRELYQNNKDEGGSFYEYDMAYGALPAPTAGVTRIFVEGPEFLTQHRNRSMFILMGNGPFLKLEGCEVHEGESSGIFYRGILVHRFPKAKVSKFTYNMTRSVDLTEDRTAKYPTWLPMQIAADVLDTTDENFLRELLGAQNSYFEHDLNFREEGIWGPGKPSPTFLKVVDDLMKDRVARTNISAIRRYKDAKRVELSTNTTALEGVEKEMLEKAVKFCKMVLHFDVTEYPLILTDTLGASVMGMVEGGNIYIARRAFMQGTKRVAATLVEEFLHIKHGLLDETREFEDFLIDRLVSLGEEKQGSPL
jgi:hypothetical protein